MCEPRTWLDRWSRCEAIGQDRHQAGHPGLQTGISPHDPPALRPIWACEWLAHLGVVARGTCAKEHDRRGPRPQLRLQYFSGVQTCRGPPDERKGPLTCGGAKGTRTPNPLLAKQVRYQLRHGPGYADPRARGERAASGSDVSLGVSVASAQSLLRPAWPGSSSGPRGRRRPTRRGEDFFTGFTSFRDGRVVGLTGLEPLTSSLSGKRSNRLSYRPVHRDRCAAHGGWRGARGYLTTALALKTARGRRPRGSVVGEGELHAADEGASRRCRGTPRASRSPS